jgi:hypothetical protein
LPLASHLPSLFLLFPSQLSHFSLLTFSSMLIGNSLISAYLECKVRGATEAAVCQWKALPCFAIWRKRSRFPYCCNGQVIHSQLFVEHKGCAALEDAVQSLLSPPPTICC